MTTAGRAGHRRRLVAHTLVLLAGLLVLAYPFTVGAGSALSCRGVTMGPGDVCVKADGSGEQTYEARLADRRNARPVVAVGGALVAGFGGLLLVGELRRRRETASTAVDAPTR